MISLTGKKEKRTKSKKWSSLITKEERVKIKKPIKINKIDKTNEIILIPKNIVDLMYPDILVSLMKYTDEKDYLNFVITHYKFIEYSFRNSVYQEYLKLYYPNEYLNILNNLKFYKTKVLNLDPKYIYYDIHYEMYPEHFEEEISNVYGLNRKEVKQYRKEAKQKELYDKWRDTIDDYNY